MKSKSNINTLIASKLKYENNLAESKLLENKIEDEDNLFEDIELSKFTIMSDLYEESIEDIIDELGD